MSDDDTPIPLRVSVAFSPRAGVVDETELLLDAGATIADALRESGLQTRYPEVDLMALSVGVWGALRSRDVRLRDRDRVEVYRPLRVDPKVARRRRAHADAGGEGRRKNGLRRAG